ncbi:MAG: tetratricopeptide repeat protein [Chloroflexota bacterium]
MTLVKPQDIYIQSARRFADHYREYSRNYQNDFDLLSNEIENIFSCIGLYGDLKAWWEVVETIQIVDDFLDALGYWEELVAGFHIAIESADNYFWMQGRNPRPEIWHKRITLRVQLSTLLFRQGEYLEARTYATEALKIARRIKHQKLEGLLLGELGNVAIVMGNYKDAERLLTQSKSMLEDFGDALNVASALGRLALLARSQGELEKSRNLQMLRLDILRKQDDMNQVGDVLTDLGDIAVSVGNFEEAENYYQESMGIYEDLKAYKAVAWVKGLRSNLLVKKGQVTDGKQLLTERLRLEQAYGDQSTILHTLESLASLTLEQGELDESFSFYQDALKLANNLRDLTTQALCLLGIGHIQELRSENDLALQSFQEGLTLALKVGYPKLIIASYNHLDLFSRKTNNYDFANQSLNELLDFLNKSGIKKEKGAVFFDLGNVASMRGKSKDAHKYYKKAFEVYRQFGQEVEMGYCLAQQSLVAFTDDDFQKSWEYLLQAINLYRSSKNNDLQEMIGRRLDDFSDIPEYQSAVERIRKTEINRAN